MPAFRVLIEEKDRGRERCAPSEYFYDNGSLAYLDAMSVMVACAEFMSTKDYAIHLLTLIEQGGNMGPVIDFYNKHNEYHSIAVERVFFQSTSTVYGVTKASIEEAKKKVLEKQYENEPQRLIIQKPTNQRETLQHWEMTGSEELTFGPRKKLGSWD